MPFGKVGIGEMLKIKKSSNDKPFSQFKRLEPHSWAINKSN
jgi:hypothetical protein